MLPSPCFQKLPKTSQKRPRYVPFFGSRACASGKSAAQTTGSDNKGPRMSKGTPNHHRSLRKRLIKKMKPQKHARDPWDVIWIHGKRNFMGIPIGMGICIWIRPTFFLETGNSPRKISGRICRHKTLIRNGYESCAVPQGVNVWMEWRCWKCGGKESAEVFICRGK